MCDICVLKRHGTTRGSDMLMITPPGVRVRQQGGHLFGC